MTGKGSITTRPGRRLRLMLLAHVSWLALVCLLGGWWTHVISTQAERISELRAALGLAAATTQAEWSRTQRMVYGETFFFFALLLATTGLVLWLYWRDLVRARGLEAFFASVTHELKTPLASIRLQAESIAEDSAEHGVDPGLVRRLLEDTVRLEGQVERTLELARVEGGGRLFPQPLSLKPWLEQFVRTYRYGADFELKLADLAAQADPFAMQVILRNLIENSIRHSRKERVSISLEGFAQGGQVELKLRDNGPGFAGSPSELGRIFLKGPGSQGAGVGLYLVKVLMERMGGRAEFANGPRGGFEASLRFEEAKASGG